MNQTKELALNYFNSAIFQSEVENSKEYELDLSIIKFDIKESDYKKFKDIINFIYKYFDFMTIILEKENTLIVFLRNSKIHASVLLIKNLNLALKIKYGIVLKNVAVTNCDKSDDILSIIERLNSFYLKSKLTHNEIYYGTKLIDFQSLNKDLLPSIVKNNPNIFVYGLYKDASIKIDGEIIEFGNDYVKIKVPKEYLSFLQKQPILYFEHKSIPEAMNANIIKTDYENSIIQITKFNFIDQSPLHRKNIRVEPPIPLKGNLLTENIIIEGLINDISINSILFTTQLQYVEELERLNYKNKILKLEFTIENLYNNNFDIEVKAIIFKIIGNQLILNIQSDSKTQNIIKEYINMCYQQLILQVQGKVV